MSVNCTRCDCTGFLNLDQIPEEDRVDSTDENQIVRWIVSHDDHDVQICDCCGNGEEWYGIPGEHYSSEDPPGPEGPYADNGGLCQCH